jgi:hypothetical protein
MTFLYLCTNQLRVCGGFTVANGLRSELNKVYVNISEHNEDIAEPHDLKQATSI